MSDDNITLYEYVGGTPFFVALVDRFYAGVADDPSLRPMYPEQDLTGARHRLAGFLVQYWGGPTDYSDERGHPRLRMRHVPYRVDQAARDSWLRHMVEAVDSSSADDAAKAAMIEYFDRAATAMINATDAPM